MDTIRLRVCSPKLGVTELAQERLSNGYALKSHVRLNGREQYEEKNENFGFLFNAGNLINAFPSPCLSQQAYRFLCSSKGQKLIKTIECLYVSEFTINRYSGSLYGGYAGEIESISIKFVSRWPWSNKDFNFGKGSEPIKELHLKSRTTSQFRATIESFVITAGGRKLSIDEEGWGMDEIEAICNLISASYIGEILYYGTFEGRVFNGGDVIRDLATKGYLSIKQ
ncbi:MAG: hypothetical protein ACI30O_01455 [Muribaculaceae bacterium]